MRPLVTALLLLTLAGTAAAETPEKFSQIRIFVPDAAALAPVWASGIDLCGVTGKPGGWMQFTAGSSELRELSRRGVSYDVVIPDLAAHYATTLPSGPANALGFGYGSMGGYYTYAEVGRQLDTMRLLYPNIVTAKESIGTSNEGRAIWAVKISDNPGLNETDEPEALYTALHHAREPMGMMSALYYMWWLLENYQTDPEAAYLVNNRQIWFIPVVNPDGYFYNQTTNPNGGGMWRKNRRVNSPGVYGVDPNRNYGPMYMWDSQIVPGGSSTSPSSDTYRGTAPFSEPENQAIDRFMRARRINAAYNYHTYGNYLIYPWGWNARESADSVLFRDWTYTMSAVNRFTPGTDMQTVNYSTRGVSDDYMYGDTTKWRTYSITPEVGTTGFWAVVADILPLAQRNLPMNKFLSHVAGSYPVLRRWSLSAGADGFLSRGEDFTLAGVVRNRGTVTATDVTVTAVSSTPYVSILTPNVAIANLAAQAETPADFAARVSPAAPTGIPFTIYVTLTDPRGFSRRDTVNAFIGVPTTVFTDSASAGTGNWTTGTGWGLTSSNHTPPNAFTDSPSGNYAANADNALTLVNQLNLAGFNHAELRFWTKWAVEATWDFATVELSTNNGSTWTTLRTNLSQTGSARTGSKQPAGSFGYDLWTPGLTWVEQAADLTPYVNRQVRLRFRMAADGGDQRDGVYVDDIRLYGYTTAFDTNLTITPGTVTLAGLPGTRVDQQVVLRNNTASPLTLAVGDTTFSGAAEGPGFERSQAPDLAPFLRRARGVPPPAPSMERNDDPAAYTVISTDTRGDNFLLGVDLLDVQAQTRTGIPGPLLDLRVRMLIPDSSVAGFLSIDTDQDFGTGRWPTPWGIGPRARDAGSEYEILVDASGRIADSLGLGRIPVALIFRTADTSAVYLPISPTITRDSVLTLTVPGIPLGTLGLNDADQNLNVGASFFRTAGLLLPDFAPDWGHGKVGAEAGVSWVRSARTVITIPPGGTDSLRVSVLAAKPSGSYSAQVNLNGGGSNQFVIPIQMNVTAGAASASLSATAFRDTVTPGDSTSLALTVQNQGNLPLLWSFVDTARTPWASATPTAGEIAPGGAATVTMKMRSAGLASNTTYTAQYLFLSNDAASGARVFPLLLRVAPRTGVKENRKEIPAEFALQQNYPNPFNPETVVGFDLPKTAFVTIKVYNLLGQELTTLLAEQRGAGSHQVRFDATKLGLTSGVYWYRMTAGEFAATRPMILSK
jgi:hypothetical protein